MGSVPGKGKDKIEVGNHLHTNTALDLAIVRYKKARHWKLRDQQLKTILFYIDCHIKTVW